MNLTIIEWCTAKFIQLILQFFPCRRDDILTGKPVYDGVFQWQRRKDQNWYASCVLGVAFAEENFSVAGQKLSTFCLFKKLK
jgi:hypothetical protein